MLPKTAGLVFFISLFALTGCSSKKQAKKAAFPGPASVPESGGSEASTPLKALNVNEYYFMASGISPDWTLDISTDGIPLMTGEEDSIMEGLERPYLEIDSQNAKFMGSASCNQMRGSLFFEPGLLRFGDIPTTRKMCPGGLEAEFLKNPKVRLTINSGTDVLP